MGCLRDGRAKASLSPAALVTDPALPFPSPFSGHPALSLSAALVGRSRLLSVALEKGGWHRRTRQRSAPVGAETSPRNGEKGDGSVPAEAGIERGPERSEGDAQRLIGKMIIN